MGTVAISGNTIGAVNPEGVNNLHARNGPIVEDVLRSLQCFYSELPESMREWVAIRYWAVCSQLRPPSHVRIDNTASIWRCVRLERTSCAKRPNQSILLVSAHFDRELESSDIADLAEWRMNLGKPPVSDCSTG